MSTCKDCIHFKICNDYEYLSGRETKVACPDYKSTEDVVPRSEVEKLYKVIFMKEDLTQKIAQERNQYFDETVILKEELDRAKQEVAKRIFEEIESLVAKYIDISIQTKSITSELNFEDMETDLAELKKKYIGETK